MKIVQIEDFFHPDAGYQINVLSKVLVEHGHDVTVVCASNLDIFPESLTSFFGINNIGARDAEFTRKYGVKIHRVKATGYYSGRTFYSSALYREIDLLNPDILFVHGNDTIPGMRYTMKARRLDYPLIMDSHMLSVATKNPLSGIFHAVYRWVFARRVNRDGLTVIRVQDDPYVIDELGVKESNAPYIGFGTDTGIFHPNYEARILERRKLGISEDDTVVLYAGKLDESKGGTLLGTAIMESFDDDSLVFVIAGNPSGPKADELVDLLSKSKNRVITLPTHKYPELPSLYQMADVAVYPAQCSLSFYDVQASGLPVIVDDGTQVNTDRVSHGNGLQFQCGSAMDLRRCISEYSRLDVFARERMKNAALAYIDNGFSYDNVAKKYESCFESTVNSFKKGK